MSQLRAQSHTTVLLLVGSPGTSSQGLEDLGVGTLGPEAPSCLDSPLALRSRPSPPPALSLLEPEKPPRLGMSGPLGKLEALAGLATSPEICGVLTLDHLALCLGSLSFVPVWVKPSELTGQTHLSARSPGLLQN